MKKLRVSKEVKWAIELCLVSYLFKIINISVIGVNNIYSIAVLQSITLYVVSLMVYIVLEKNSIDDIYRDMILCFGGTALLRQICLQERYVGNLDIGTQLAIVIGIYEAIFILIALKNKRCKIGLRRAVLYNFIAVIIGLAGVYLVSNKLTLLMENGSTNVLYSELQGVIFILCAIAVISSCEVRERFEEEEYRSLYFFLISRTIVQGIIVVDSFINHPILLIMIAVTRIVSNYFVFKVFIVGLFRKHMNQLILNQPTLQTNKMNDALQELDKEYKELLRLLPDGVAIVQNNVITFANDKLVQLFKMTNHLSLEKKNIYHLIHRSDHKKFAKLVENHNNKFLTLVHFNLMGYDFAGETKIIYKDNDKKENDYIVIIRDITERLEMQRMENMLLEKAEAEKIKSQVLANISHEFKTPVNVIYAATQLQGQNIAEENWEGVGKYNPVISQNCNRLIRLINNFIDSTRFDYGEFAMNKICMNVVTVVEDITLSIVSFAENKGISVLFDTEEEEIFCKLDIDMIERIILNLLSNAIKYNKPGGDINVEISQNNEFVEIKIEDTGIGIEKDKLHMLFNRFERVDKSLVRDNEGSGLGLNIVKNMISSLGGDIKVESNFGEGTIMRVYLPIHEVKEGDCCEEAAQLYNSARLKKSVEMELSDIYE